MANERNDSKIADEIPPLDQLERRFSFIHDDALRRNTVVAFEYITFLVAVMDHEHVENTSVGSSIHKNMILYTASIVEGCLHYCLSKCLESGKVKEEDVLKTEWCSKDPKKIYTISDDEYVAGVVMRKETRRYDSRLPFQELNRSCEKAGILTDLLLKKAENIREKRNKIHLASLGKVEPRYTKDQISNVFKETREIIERIENMLSKS